MNVTRSREVRAKYEEPQKVVAHVVSKFIEDFIWEYGIDECGMFVVETTKVPVEMGNWSRYMVKVTLTKESGE